MEATLRLRRPFSYPDAGACEPVGSSEVQVTDLVASERAISFGPFRLVPTQRLLLEDDNPVRVGSRALDILTALVERPGKLVGATPAGQGYRFVAPVSVAQAPAAAAL